MSFQEVSKISARSAFPQPDTRPEFFHQRSVRGEDFGRIVGTANDNRRCQGIPFGRASFVQLRQVAQIDSTPEMNHEARDMFPLSRRYVKAT